jgi:carboxyl-terminal processing protease
MIRWITCVKDVWMKRQRGIAWILFNLALGVLGGVTLGWGPLAVSAPVTVALGVLGAGITGGLAWVSARAERRRWVLVGHGMVLVGVALSAIIPLYRIGTIRVSGNSWSSNFEQLWQAMDYAYPYFEEKGVDWDEMHARYAPQVAGVNSDEGYWRIVAHMLAELNDGHTEVLTPSAQGGRRYFATCRDVNGIIVVNEVGTTARAAGLESNDVVIQVGELPIEEALNALSPLLRTGSTPWHRRARAAFHVLSTTGDTLTVTVSGSTGKRTVTLVWPVEGSAPTSAEPSPWKPLITGERLPSGFGLIRIPSFGAGHDHDLVAEFDAALSDLMETPGLILDLRGNGGGSTFISDPIAGRFLDRPFTYGRDYFRARLPQRGWRPHFDYRVKPRGATYTGLLVVLIDERVFSTGENFVVALVDSGRATTIGRQTGGGSGNPVEFALTGGGRARFSTGEFRRNDSTPGAGNPLEGVGITPDVAITWTVEDILAGDDPDLDAAIALLSLFGE